MASKRPVIALCLGLLAAVAVMLPFVWVINNRDWGVVLMFIAPVIIYGLIRLARKLSEWAGSSPPPSF